MKKNVVVIMLTIFAVTISTIAQAQIKGNGNVTKQTHEVGTFDGIKIDGAKTMVLTQGDNYSVTVETDSNIQEYIDVRVKNGILVFEFNTKNIKKYKILKFYVTSPNINYIKCSGATDISSSNTLSGNNLKINISGASDVDLNVDYTNITTTLSGASDVTLSGTATSSIIESSGASSFDGKDLVTTSTVAKASGASSCVVNANSSLSYEVSGASDVKYVSKPETVIIKNNNGSSKVSVITSDNDYNYDYNYHDTTDVNVGLLHVNVVEGDTTQVTVGRHTLVVTDDGDVTWKRCKLNRFNGHWGGVELGINGYVTPDFKTNWGQEYDYLNLKYEKSIAVNLNIYEQNITLNKSKTLGLITGLGLSWNNYRFTNSTYLSSDSSIVQGYYMKGVSIRKTKLTAMYLTVPLIFEMQTNNPFYLHRFHFGIGVVGKMRISTHTKVYFNEADKIYQLQDPATGQTIPGDYRTPNTNNRNIVKNFDSFYLRPFKFDATVRIGYGIINLFATYSLTSMFQSDRGPELYPITAGITIVGW